MPLGMRPLTSSSDIPAKRPLPSDKSEESYDGHFDDLMFMLKTQNFSESFASDESEQSGPVGFQKRPSKSGAEHFERRRISIADTHL